VGTATRNGTAHSEPAGGGVCNLFMDFETFGEHQWAETGIFQFLEQMPDAILARGDMAFVTPGECFDNHEPADEFDVPHMISWADTERDLSAWLGNAMQSNALHELYQLEEPVKAAGDPQLLADWRKLTSSDHFYYMCTKYMADGDVHKYFNPYESPYDSYINFMNVLDNLRTRVSDSR
jgi:alpha-amylase